MNSGFDFMLYLHSQNPLVEVQPVSISFIMHNGIEISGELVNRAAAHRKLGESIEQEKAENDGNPEFEILMTEVNSVIDDSEQAKSKERERSLREPLIDDMIALKNAKVLSPNMETKTYDTLCIKGSAVMAFTIVFS